MVYNVATMKTVSIREFVHNIYGHLDDLPLVITKRGKPYLKVELVGNVATSENVATKVATKLVSLPASSPVSKPAKRKGKKTRPTGWQAGNFGGS